MTFMRFQLPEQSAFRQHTGKVFFGQTAAFGQSGRLTGHTSSSIDGLTAAFQKMNFGKGTERFGAASPSYFKSQTYTPTVEQTPAHAFEGAKTGANSFRQPAKDLFIPAYQREEPMEVEALYSPPFELPSLSLSVSLPITIRSHKRSASDAFCRMVQLHHTLSLTRVKGIF